MSASFEELFALLGTLAERLDQLKELAQEQLEAVRHDDLMGLNEVLNREQAAALEFRGLEQKREKLLSELSLGGSSLSSLPLRCPPEKREAAERCVAQVKNAYGVYRKTADEARGLLEHEIRDIDAILGARAAEISGPGYSQESAVSIPPKMKTDFRA